MQGVFRRLREDGLQITTIFVSHPDKDHINLFPDVFPADETPSVLPHLQRVVYGGKLRAYDQQFTRWLTQLRGSRNRRIPVEAVGSEGECVCLGTTPCERFTHVCGRNSGVMVDVLSANLAKGNPSSLVLRISFASFVALLPGERAALLGLCCSDSADDGPALLCCVGRWSCGVRWLLRGL